MMLFLYYYKMYRNKILKNLNGQFKTIKIVIYQELQFLSQQSIILRWLHMDKKHKLILLAYNYV